VCSTFKGKTEPKEPQNHGHGLMRHGTWFKENYWWWVGGWTGWPCWSFPALVILWFYDQKSAWTECIPAQTAKKCNDECKKGKEGHFTGTVAVPIAVLTCNCFPTLKQVYLPNIPNWDWKMGDSIICFAELKLGFMAQSCLVPGLSTLLTSLFIGKENAEVNPLTWFGQAKNTQMWLLGMKLP